ncbi:single-stranded-DNA-specific exonuclease RecJ [Candidatus Woesebacteria bacterium]|nr:single-stranded-DNA-specific exonuclease RecJ [Candidatus Woesebacteria bacterium]
MTSQKAQWHLLHEQSPNDASEMQKWLLQDRDIKNVENFLLPPKPDSLTLNDVGIVASQMKKAVARLIQAKKMDQKVVIAGDYDADGICATAVLWLACKEIGLIAQPFIPNRHKHGYGLNQRSIPDMIGEDRPDLVITVDNGIVAHEAIETLSEMGIDVIISDHHEKASIDPNALAIVHTTQLCGAGVAWFLANQLLKTTETQGADTKTNQLLDLVSIATIADQVPLIAANRSLVFHGLLQLKTTQRPGLQAIFEMGNIDQTMIDEVGVSFQIAPRLNALGRLSHGMDALRLLCGGTIEFAQQRARLLEAANTERQEITQDLYARANQLAQEQTAAKILIIAGSEFHEGIIGLLAGRLVEQYGKPAIVISVNEALAKGSVRSIPGVHITDFLRQMSDSFLELGGHAMAAGFAVEPMNLDKVIEKIYTMANKLTIENAAKQIEITCPLKSELINLDTVSKIESLAPFGQANPKPLFLLSDWQVVGVKTIGNEGKHLKLVIAYMNELDNQKTVIEALWWKHGDQASSFQSGMTISLVGRLEKQTWRNKSFPQIIVVDAHV